MSEVKKYANGFRSFEPKPGQPDFVLGAIAVVPEDLLKWCNENPELCGEYQGKKQVWHQILKSRDGKVYTKLNTRKQSANSDDNGDGLPF